MLMAYSSQCQSHCDGVIDTYRVSPPKGIVIVAHSLLGSLPVRPSSLDRNTSQDSSNGSRQHEQGAVCYRSPAYHLKDFVGENADEDGDDGDFGEADGWDIRDLRDPGVL
jgi:hypothetical protein